MSSVKQGALLQQNALDKFSLECWAMQVCSVDRARMTIGLCLSVYFAKATLLPFMISDENSYWLRLTCNLKIGFLKNNLLDRSLLAQVKMWNSWNYMNLHFYFKLNFLFVVYVLGLQHELAQIMHVFWLSKHDAHCSVTENPCALPVCFCGHHVYEE